MEYKILKKIDKELSFVYCSSKEEIPKRIGDIEEFLNRPNGKMFITTVDAMQGLTGFTDKYRDKILFVNNPKLPEEKMPNSLTALMLATVASHSTSKIILFGADGLLGSQSNAIDTYFGKEKLIKENRSCNLVNDTIRFNNTFLDYLNHVYEKYNVEPIEIINCSINSYLTPFKKVSYDELLIREKSNLSGTLEKSEKLKYLKAWEFDNRSYADCSPGFKLSNSLKFLDYFKQNNVRTILDAGCGSGKLLKRMLDMGFECRGTDIAENCLEPDLKPLQDQLLKVGLLWRKELFSENQFDAVVCTDVLEHIPPQFVEEVLQNIYYWANRYVFLQIALFEDRFGKTIAERLHLTVKPKKWWDDQLLKFGYKVITSSCPKNDKGEEWYAIYLLEKINRPESLVPISHVEHEETDSESQLFTKGNYAAVAMGGSSGQWQTYAAMGLVGKAQEAIEGLSRFDHPEARFYSAVASWIDGDEITATSILGKIPTLHAQNLLTLIRKPQIQVLSQFPTREYFLTESMEDRKFQVRNLGFFPQDLPNEPHADIHKFYDFHNPPDFYICKVVEWLQIPPNIQELPCPIFGATVDYDIHVQTVYPWLRLFDELTVPDPSVWEGVHKLVQVPVSTFPKFYSLPARLPPAPTGPREIDVFLSGTVLHPYHPDKSQLLHQILSRPDIKSLIINKHLHPQSYMDFLCNSKVCYAYVRFTASMPTRALDALSMGCAVVIQKGSVLGLYLGEEHGVLTYELESENLAPTIRHILDHWPEFEQRARHGSATVRREFALPRVASQYLRFLTFLAAKPRGQRQRQPAEHLVQKRSVFRKGYFPPPGSNKDNPILAKTAESSLVRLRTHIRTEGLSSCLLIDAAREIVLCCRNTEAMSNTAKWLIEPLRLYRMGIANFPQSLVLRLNFIRVAMQFGQTQEIEKAIQLTKETLNTPASNWKIDVMEDVFSWDFNSATFNYRKYFDLITEHLMRGTPVNSALTQLILAALYYYLGRYSNNLDHFKQAVTLDPEFPFYRFYYAKILIQRGQPEDYTQAGILLTQLAENSILFVEAFCLLKQLQEKQLYISPKFEELAAKVFNYSFNYFVHNTWLNGNDFTTNFLDGL